MDHIVKKFKGLKWVQQIKKGGKNNKPCYMKNSAGKNEASQTGMANVFGEFYKELYSTKHPNDKNTEFISKNAKMIP